MKRGEWVAFAALLVMLLAAIAHILIVTTPDVQVTATVYSSESTVSAKVHEPLQDALIDINTADAVLLQKLKGIGDKKAESIIAYREENGPFSKIEDIMNVSGIGEKIFEDIKDFIKV